MNDIQHFATEQDAINWMYEVVHEEDCIDNTRFAFTDDEKAMAEYEDAQANGCCGYFDSIVIVNGREATVGCNYGH